MITADDVLRDAPGIHGEAEAAGTMTYALVPEALRRIEQIAAPGSRTLETGAGHSTIVFIGAGCEHICVMPFQAEVDRIRAYCESKGVATERATFHVGPSERVLPTLDIPELDTILIDGSHSFPQVFIDWFYTASALRVGGALLIDDVHLWTGRILRDFLRDEPEWEMVDELAGRTSEFRKLAEVDPDKLWVKQRYVARKSHLGPPSWVRMSASMIRNGHARDLPKHVQLAVRARLGR